MSRPAEDRAIVDAGLKALAFDSGLPIVCDEPAATYERASDERGRLAVSAATNRLGLGDKIRLIPRDCDPTVNSTIGMCASAATASSRSGRSPPAAPFTDPRRRNAHPRPAHNATRPPVLRSRRYAVPLYSTTRVGWRATGRDRL